MPSSFRPYQTGDLKTEARFEQYVRGLERKIAELEDRLANVPTADRRLASSDLATIRAALQAGGVAELDLTNLVGRSAEQQFATLPRVTAHPDPVTTTYDTYVLVGSPFSTIWQIDREQNPPVAVQIATVANHSLLSATHTDTLAASVVRGDILVGNSTPLFARLALGAANLVLRVNAGGTDPEWGAVPDAALSANVALLNRSPQTFTGANTFAETITSTKAGQALLISGVAAANTKMIEINPASLGAVFSIDAEGDVIASAVTVGSTFTADAAVVLSGTVVIGVGDSPYTIAAGVFFVQVNTSGGAITVNMPASVTLDRHIVIKDVSGDAAANNITVSGNGNSIDGAGSQTINVDYGSVWVVGIGGSDWGLV